MARTTSVSGNGNLTIQADCQANEVAIAGGGNDSGGKALTKSQPMRGSSAAANGERPTGWQVQANGNGNSSLTVYVLCAPAS